MKNFGQMRNIAPMRTAKTGYVIMSVMFVLFGLLLLADPDHMGRAAGSIIGVALMLFGIFKMVGYFSKDLFRLAFQYDLAFGILLEVLGIIILSKPSNFIDFITVVIGIAFLADGLLKIQISLDSRKFGISKWWTVLAMAILTGAVGAVLVVSPAWGSELLLRILGIAFITEGILNFITVITAVKIIRHQRPDVIDTKGEWI